MSGTHTLSKPDRHSRAADCYSFSYADATASADSQAMQPDPLARAEPHFNSNCHGGSSGLNEAGERKRLRRARERTKRGFNPKW